MQSKFLIKKYHRACIFRYGNFEKKKILSKDFKNYKNFEEKLYPQIIKKYTCKFHKFSGFWHSIDNIKDIRILRNDKKKKKKN